MDVDPLADTGPARYQVESDEEEDEYNPLRNAGQEDPSTQTEVNIVGDLPQGRALIVATGDISKYWSSSADLGEQRGAVFVNKVQVGLAFRPKWTEAIIIASEILTRLPVWAMFDYANKILLGLQPERIVLLDTYPAPTYISEQRIAFTDAPIRYLGNAVAKDSDALKNVSKFSPPNLLQSTTAAFFSCLETTYTDISGYAVLIPSSHAPRPAPRQLEPSNFQELAADQNEWNDEIVNTAQEVVFGLAKQQIPTKWSNTKGGTDVQRRRRADEIGEGGMYI